MNKVKLQKIGIKHLIDLLQHLHSRGAEFIDIIGLPDTEQDAIDIIVRTEYIKPGCNFYDEFSENFVQQQPSPITEEYLNLLINA